MYCVVGHGDFAVIRGLANLLFQLGEMFFYE